jgi:hypothetical protein
MAQQTKMGKKYRKGDKKYQIATKYTKKLHSSSFKNTPKLAFLV